MTGPQQGDVNSQITHCQVDYVSLTTRQHIVLRTSKFTALIPSLSLSVSLSVFNWKPMTSQELVSLDSGALSLKLRIKFKAVCASPLIRSVRQLSEMSAWF